MPDCLWRARRLANGVLEIQYMSPQSIHLWGRPELPESADVDRRKRPMILEEDRALADAAIAAACASGEPQTTTYRIRRSDGTIGWIEDRIIPERMLHDGTCTVTGLARDISERHQQESRVLERQRQQSLGLLAGGVAHDFNNILMAILGQTSVVRKQLGPDAPGQAELRVVEQAAKRAADLCRQLLAYAGRGRFEVQHTEVNQLVDDMRGLIQAVLPKSIRLELDFDGDLPQVEVDPTQIRQAIVNIVANAGESMQESGGILRIAIDEAQIDDANAPEFSEHLKAGRYIRVTLVDQGPGMSDDIVARAFDPFFTTKPGGHGIGLASALGVIRGHGGDIRLASQPGQGTTVTVYLPTSERRAPALVPSEPPPRLDTKGEALQVLVVEDEPTVRQIVKRMLELSGHQVVLACDGVEGLERYDEAPDSFGLAVLDLTMPRMNGIETLRALRERSSTLPILMTSGHAEEDAVQQAVRESELVAFIQKPYRYGELMSKVQRLLASADSFQRMIARD